MEEIKIKRERSRSYPRINLEECIQSIIKIKQAIGKGEHDKVTFAKALGYKDICGIFLSKISALIQFGLLVKKKVNYYSIADSALKITDPLSDNEKNVELLEAFKRPNIYFELLNEFEQGTILPKNIETILHRKYNITESAAKTAAQIFKESGVYAKAFNEEGKILISLNDDSEVNSLEKTEESNLVGITDNKEILTDKLENEIIKGQHQHSFPLSEGMALIKLPGKISKKDIQKIRKYLEFIEMEIEE
ncbi:MAG: hypothetical protein PHX78_05890 [bacterium]|nr:hypothetical protein [bacterium]